MTPEEAKKIVDRMESNFNGWPRLNFTQRPTYIEALRMAADALDAYANLPMTKDGGRVVPGMNLFASNIDYDFGCLSISVESDEPELLCRDVRGVEFRMRADECFSTRAAAEAAAKEAT